MTDTIQAQAQIARKNAFVRALQIRENWSPEQLEAELVALAEQAQAMLEAGQVTVLPTRATFPGGAAWRAPVRAAV